MRILDNYITRSIIGVFLSTIVIFTLLYVLIDATAHLDDFISNHVPALLITKYYLAFLPVIFVQTSPIACLLAVLFAYSSLNNNNEIIALRACGLSFWKITRPALIFGLIITAFVFLVNEKFAPQAASVTDEIKSEAIELGRSPDKNKETIKHLFFYGLDNKLFFIDSYDPNDNTLLGLTIIGQDEQQNMTDKISALKGEWTGTQWKLFNCQVTRYDTDDPTIVSEALFFKEKLLDIQEKPIDLLRQRKAVSNMNIKELKAYIKRSKASGATSALRNLKVDLHARIAYPFACIIIIFVGLPFALVTGRRKGLTFASVGIALAIGLLFYVVNSVGLALGKGGAIHPTASAWLAPSLFIFAGAWISRELF